MQTALRTLELPRARLLALSLPAAFRPPSAAHAEPRVAVVLAGSLGEELAGGTRELRQNDIRIAPAAAPHRLAVGDRGLRCLIVELPSGTPWGKQSSAPRARCASDRELVTLSGSLVALLADPAAAAQVRARRLGAELAARAARLGRGLDGKAMPSWLADLAADLAREPHRRSALATLGASAGVHAVQVARAFREHYGCSIGEWRRLRRLEHACLLLEASATGSDRGASPSLADVAAEAGFADQAHLTRSVRRALGTTPARLRRGRPDVSPVQDASAAGI